MTHTLATIHIPAPAREKKRNQYPLRFLIFALAAHLAFLTLPVGLRAPVNSQPLAIEIVTSPIAEPLTQQTITNPSDPEVKPEQPKQIQNQTAPEPPVPEVTGKPNPVEPLEPLSIDQLEPKTTIPSYDRLLSTVREIDWSEKSAKEHLPARSVESQLVEQWRKPIVPSLTTAFTEDYAPGSVEVLDQWLEPGGVQKTVIRTPTGHTLCGRQEAVDEMRPWLTKPMMWKNCAGGGRRD